MLFILFGEDDFSLKEELQALKASIGPPEVWESNITNLSSEKLTLAEVQGICNTTPFLARKRLVIVNGLLSSLEGKGKARGARMEASEWTGLKDYVRVMPPTTDLVLMDGSLSRENPLLRELAPVAQVREFPMLRGEELRQWVKERAAQKGVDISPGALTLLMELVGGNLWVMEGELEKLSLHATGRRIQEEDVRELSYWAQEAHIFSAVDAILERNASLAIRFVRRLLTQGASVSYILVMLARQLRLLLLAQGLEREKVPEREKARRMGLTSPYALKKTLEQALRYSWEELTALYDRLVQIDASIKQGSIKEELALELLVAELGQPHYHKGRGLNGP